MQLEVSSVTKSYGEKVVLDNLSFEAKKGELIVLVGPSGCGKSTMLRSIAGLEMIDSGKIAIGDADVTDLVPKDRNIAMVFQDYALYPHLTVYENIAFGLRVRKQSQQEIDRKVKLASDKLGLGALLKRKPAALSGGQRQRVAIGRAIVREPELFLFDEPLSNLDAKLRGSMRLTIARLHEELGATIVYVTHDQVEAMTLADQIIVLNEGRIQQMGHPLHLYYHPNNRFVATFIGSPPMNMLTGELTGSPGQWGFRSDKGLAFTFPQAFQDQIIESVASGQKVTWGIRAENFTPEQQSGDSVDFTGSVIVTEPLGATTSVLMMVNGHELLATVQEPYRPKAGDEIKLAWQSSHVYLFDDATGDSLVRKESSF